MNVVCYSRDWRFTVSEHGKEEKVKQREITGNLRNNATIFYCIWHNEERLDMHVGSDMPNQHAISTCSSFVPNMMKTYCKL